MYLPLYKVADTPFHIQGDEKVKMTRVVDCLSNFQYRLHSQNTMCFAAYIYFNNYRKGFQIIYLVILTCVVLSNKLRCNAGFGLVEMAISTNQKPTIYRNWY